MKFRRWLLVLLVVLIASLAWLNGPGLRFIAPKVIAHFLEKSGIRGDLKIGGSLTSGLTFSDIRIATDGSLADLSIAQVIPDYQFGSLLKGRLDGLTVNGAHVALNLGAAEAQEKEKQPLDLAKLVETIRSVRGHFLPVKVDLNNVSLAVTRDGKTEFKLAPSRIYHASGTSDIQLEIGALTDATGREWEARKSSLVWSDDELAIARLDPLPGLSLRGFALRLPAGGEPSLDVSVHLDDAVFVVSSTPGFSSASVDLREGSLRVEETLKRFGVTLPARAKLTSLAIDVNGILPDPQRATGSVRISLDEVIWQDWSVPEISLDAKLSDDQVTLVSRGLILGTPISIEAAAPLTRQLTRFALGDVTGKFNIADVPQALRNLAPRVPAIDSEAPIPASSVDGNFTITMQENKPFSALTDLVLKPLDLTLATPVAIKGRWETNAPLTAEIVLDGMKAAISYQTEPATYQGTVELDEFTTTRIDRWLATAKIKTGGAANLTGTWKGNGAIKTGKHTGELSFTNATWARAESEAITGIGGISYDWPTRFETRGLKLQMNEQTVSLEAALASGLLELRRLVWSDGKNELAEMTASLPVPEDFSKWREALTKDVRAIAVSINSRVLSLGLLKDWHPAFAQFDPRSTGQVQINLSGTYSAPVIAAKLEARDLRSPSQPKLPPADLVIELTAKEGHLDLTSSTTAPDFPPAEMKASMPFRPAEWAETPALIQDERVEARVELPRVDISRFATLVPTMSKLAGILTGNVVVSGTAGKPVIKGAIDLTKAEFRFKSERYPAIESAGATVEFALDRVELKKLKASVAGGSLVGSGTLAINDGKLGDLNLRLQGDHLPLLRNDLLILRANADLRLQGPWERAVLSGTVGAVDSVFYRDIELLPIGVPFTGPSAAALPKIDASSSKAVAMPLPFANWGVNLTVKSEEPVFIRGNLATGEITGSMRVGGTLAAPSPDGVFFIKNFKASLPFSTLSVPSGSVTFKPASGFDPILEIRGTAEPRPYLVTAFVYGRASNPQLVLTSNPPMPENEIMTLLATGTTTTGLENPQAASSRAMQLLAEEVRRGRFRFGKQLRPVLGLLDRVDFSLSESDPYSSDSYSTATLALTDRWFVSAGVGATGDSRYLAIWRFSFK